MEKEDKIIPPATPADLTRNAEADYAELESSIGRMKAIKPFDLLQKLVIEQSFTTVEIAQGHIRVAEHERRLREAAEKRVETLECLLRRADARLEALGELGPLNDDICKELDGAGIAVTASEMFPNGRP